MKIEFLGSGGANTTPRPLCRCAVCMQAAKRGRPYSRTGPSVFVHGPDVLIDTPEESKEQICHSTINHITGGLYSHWHPDHVAGMRVWEMNRDWRGWPPDDKHSQIWLPEQVAKDFRQRGLFENFKYMQSIKIISVTEMVDGDNIQIDKTTILPFRLAMDYAYGFMFSKEGKRVLIIMDELLSWLPEAKWCKPDLAILPMGILDVDPVSGKRRIPEDHPVLTSEATFNQTLKVAERLQAKQTIIGHIEEPDGMGHDELQALAKKITAKIPNFSFAWDGMIVEV